LKLRKVNRTQSEKIYKQREWLDSLGNAVDIIEVLNNNNELIGSFVIQESSIKRFKALHTPIFQSNIALDFLVGSDKTTSKISNEKKLFEALVNFINESKAKIVDVSFPYEFADMQAFQWAGFDVKPKYTYTIDLNLSEEELLSNLDSSTRSNLKKAQKDLTCIADYNASESLRICDLTFSRQDKSYHRDILKGILEKPNLAENRKSYFVSDGKKNIAVVEIVYDAHSAYYLIGGYDSNSKHRGANTLAMWNAILDVKKQGVKLFDFQGSMIPKVEKFVRGFGGEKRTYFSVQKMPWYYKLGKSILKS